MPDPRPAATPPPSPPQSQSDPDEAASSPASAPDSRTSEGAGFIADGGPTFDPERAAEQLPPPPLEATVLPPPVEWKEDTIEALLNLKGRAVHSLIGVADEDWRYTQLDLAAIAPPLTRICNRYEPVQQLAKHADPLLVLMALGGYSVRSLEERRAVFAELAEAEPQPIAPLADDQPINGPQPPPPPPTPATAPRQFAPASVPQADVDAETLEWSTAGGQ